MEEDFQHIRVGSVPAVSTVVGFRADAIILQVRAEVVVDRVFRTVGKEIKIERRG